MSNSFKYQPKILEKKPTREIKDLSRGSYYVIFKNWKIQYYHFQLIPN